MANTSFKRLQISKANSQIVIATSGAAFIVTFSLIAGQALLNKRSYQNKVIRAKETAVNQLQENVKAANNLSLSYKSFVETSSNVLGGNPAGTGDKDGDNGKIVLDALPSQYDFPSLTSSIEKLMKDNGYKANAISGTDDELVQKKNLATGMPQPIAIPFTIAVTTNAEGAKNLVALLEKSIRPINVKSVTLSGSNSAAQVTIAAETYYQPRKGLNIELKVVK